VDDDDDYSYHGNNNLDAVSATVGHAVPPAISTAGSNDIIASHDSSLFEPMFGPVPPVVSSAEVAWQDLSLS
jgi:hypothetical protein